MILNWQQVCDNQRLQNLPFKIELNRWGQVIMSPAHHKHSILQGEIAGLLRDLTKRTGRIATKCPIQTKTGILVADVAWFSVLSTTSKTSSGLCDCGRDLYRNFIA